MPLSVSSKDSRSPLSLESGSDRVHRRMRCLHLQCDLIASGKSSDLAASPTKRPEVGPTDPETVPRASGSLDSHRRSFQMRRSWRTTGDRCPTKSIEGRYDELASSPARGSRDSGPSSTTRTRLLRHAFDLFVARLRRISDRRPRLTRLACRHLRLRGARSHLDPRARHPRRSRCTACHRGPRRSWR